MLYGLAGTVNKALVDRATAALPDCYSQELSNCLDHQNTNGLPGSQCDAITAAYHDTQDTAKAMDDVVNALPMCKAPSMIPYVGAAFAAGVFLTMILVRR